MAVFPSDSIRTKQWGTEVLTTADLHSQLDLLHTYLQAALNSSTGHAHTGAANQGPKLSPANMVIASQAQGDTLYASSATAWARLAKGTASQVLQMKSDATIPEWVSSGVTDGSLVRMTTGDKLPAVDGSLLTNLTGANVLTPLGAWNPYSTGTTKWVKDTSFLAATDGIVLFQIAGTNSVDGYAYTDVSNPPTTSRLRGYWGGTGSITFPASLIVKKGDYWKVTGSIASDSIFWIPLGS